MGVYNDVLQMFYTGRNVTITSPLAALQKVGHRLESRHQCRPKYPVFWYAAQNMPTSTSRIQPEFVTALLKTTDIRLEMLQIKSHGRGLGDGAGNTGNS